jgi:hypothetical protein
MVAVRQLLCRLTLLLQPAHNGSSRANPAKTQLLPKRSGSCLKSRAAGPRFFILHRNSDFLGKATMGPFRLVFPGCYAEVHDRSHPRVAEAEGVSEQADVLPGVRNLTGFDLHPLGNRQSGQWCDLLKRAAVRNAGFPDQFAKDLTGCKHILGFDTVPLIRSPYGFPSVRLRGRG